MITPTATTMRKYLLLAFCLLVGVARAAHAYQRMHCLGCGELNSRPHVPGCSHSVARIERTVRRRLPNGINRIQTGFGAKALSVQDLPQAKQRYEEGETLRHQTELTDDDIRHLTRELKQLCIQLWNHAVTVDVEGVKEVIGKATLLASRFGNDKYKYLVLNYKTRDAEFSKQIPLLMPKPKCRKCSAVVTTEVNKCPECNAESADFADGETWKKCGKITAYTAAYLLSVSARLEEDTKKLGKCTQIMKALKVARASTRVN